MPRGLSKIRQEAEAAAARRAAYDEGGPGLRYLRLSDGETARVRFCEQGDEVWMVWTHQLPAQGGRKFGDKVMCLDQDDTGAGCPGCERQKTRSGQVCINLIWFGAPKFERDKDNKIVKDGNSKPKIIGNEDTIATWVTGSTNGGRLEYLDSQFGGLTGQIFKIHRQGATKDDTKYFIDIDEKDKPPSPAEVELFKGKPDPRNAIKTLTYGDMARAYSGGGQAGATPGPSQPAEQPAEGNAFAQAAAGGGINRGAFG